ncbi:MAG: response regulator [Pirellulales bacterium]
MMVLRNADENSHPQAPRTDRLDCHILLAEDDQDHQRLYSMLLRRAGSRVTVVKNGQVAVELVQTAGDGKVPFDVILMDMRMPVLNGYDATRQLRQAGFAGPIIALTAYAISTDRDKCLAAGCDEYASKPVDGKDLLSLVARYAPLRACERSEVGAPSRALK